MPTVWDMKLPLLQREKMLSWIRRRSKIYRKKWTSNKTFFVNRIIQEILDAWSIIAVICRNLEHYFSGKQLEYKTTMSCPCCDSFWTSVVIINISTSENIFFLNTEIKQQCGDFSRWVFCSIFAGKDTEKQSLMLRWLAAWDTYRLRSRKITNAIQ